MTEILIISFLAALLNIETIQFGQFLISRPSFAGFLFGLVTGNYFEGFIAGIVIEAIYLDFTPIGGAVPPNGVFAVATFSVIHKAVGNFSAAFFISIVAGFAYAMIDKFIRTHKNSWNKAIIEKIEAGTFNSAYFTIKSIFLDLAAFFVCILICAFVFIPITKKTLFYPFVSQSFSIAFLAIPFIAVSSLYFRIRTQVGKNE